MTPVKIGMVSEDYAEITEGLNEGDKVFYPLAVQSRLQERVRGPGMGMMMGGGRPPGSGRR